MSDNNNKRQKLENNNEIDITKQEHESNSSSFSKGVIEFKIKAGIEESEWLFWKVFRNKFIYKTIMSNMDTVISIPYHSLINIQTMINWGQLNILRDKVIRNQYLTFNESDSFCGNFRSRSECNYIDTFNLIFQSFKQDNDQDRLFYKHLFKNYGQYSTLFNNVDYAKPDKTLIDIQDGRNKLVNQLIELKCIPAIQVFIQEYQYKPSQDNLKTVISIGSLKLFKLFLQPQFDLQLSGKITNIKILNHCYSVKLLDIQELELHLHSISNIVKVEELALKLLITICKSILKCTNRDFPKGFK